MPHRQHALVGRIGKMAKLLVRRLRPASLPPVSAKAFTSFIPPFRSSYCSGAATFSGDEAKGKEEKGKWFTLPPFTPQIDASAVAREISGLGTAGTGEPTKALKWVRRCCPQLPMSLLQKLFRLRQVRKHLSNIESSGKDTHVEQLQIRRVSSEDTLTPGDVILLPVSVRKLAAEKYDCFQNENEVNYIRSLELYKDPAIIVINKPPGMPVQGGVGIKYSMDALAATCLKYDFAESPRLAHRLDRDSSGILVLGRTQTSTSILHCIFREKTSGALIDNIKNTRRALQRKYLALVIGTPKRSKGLISAPLAKIVLEDGASERVTIVNDSKSTSSQHALTEYKVIKSSIHGYTWLELCPLTGRKHQLRVHCAEVLRTPIVGDYKYGWHANRKWEPMPLTGSMTEHEMLSREKLPFGLELDGGSIAEKQPRLHLHCKQMVLPNISVALHELQSSSAEHDFSKLERLTFVAPLPLHMQRSWEILSS